MTGGVGRGRRRRADQRGAATAELALVLPALVAVTAGLAWLLAVGVAQVQVVDAAREAARAAARGDADASAVDRGRRVAPPGGLVTVRRAEGEVLAAASAEVAGPGGLFDFLPSVRVRATATALDEQAAGGAW